MTGAIKRHDVPACSGIDCVNDFQNCSPNGGAALEAASRPAERIAALACGSNESASADAAACAWTIVQEPPTVAKLLSKASPLAWGIPPIDLKTALIEVLGAARGACRTGCVHSERSFDPRVMRSPREARRGALRAGVVPAKAVPSRGRQVAAERETATCPRSDQRVGSVEQPHGCSRRALRVGAPQGPKDFGERSDAEVYGATPSSAVKETTTLPKLHWGDGRSCGRRSPSGESPKASRGATTKSVHPSISVERGEA